MYKIVFMGYEEDDLYPTYEEAEEVATTMCDDYRTGDQLLYMSNPGDWAEEEGAGEEPYYDIIEA